MTGILAFGRQLFLDHPRSVEESYLAHARVALWFAGRLFLAGGAALVHAVIPGLCKTTARRLIGEMQQRMDGR